MALADLWALAIGERQQFRERGQGLERVHTIPILLLHRRRVVAFAGQAAAYLALDALRPRFPDARLVPFPGGAADALVVDLDGVPEVLAAYGAGRPAPVGPAVAAVLAWAAQAGPPAALPADLAAATADPDLVPALAGALARGQVRPRRALAAAGTDPALDFLAWALVPGDLEFQAKYGHLGEAACAALAFLPGAAALALAQRLLAGREASRAGLQACLDRVAQLGPAACRQAAAWARGHPLEAQVRRWLGLEGAGTGGTGSGEPE